MATSVFRTADVPVAARGQILPTVRPDRTQNDATSARTLFTPLPIQGRVATKGAVEQLSRVLAEALGPKGITVNVVSPGPTDIELFSVGKTEEQKRAFARTATPGRLGAPEDVAAAVAVPVGPDAGRVPGQNV
jgi:3-oxoacyl-[acyl-carrier protein] reductase